MRPYRVFLIVALSVTSICIAPAQLSYRYSADAEHSFSIALQRFQLGNFSEATVMFDQLIKIRPVHQRTTAAYIMSAKGHFQMKEYDISTATAQELLKAFPSTSYRYDALYVLGLDEMMQQRYAEAMKKFLEVSFATRDSVLSGRASSCAELIAGDRLPAPALTELMHEIDGRRAKDLLALKLAERYAAAGDAVHSKEMLAMISSDTHGATFNKRMRQLNQQLSAKALLKIGVILPPNSSSSSDPTTSLSNEVLDGITYALEEFKATGRLTANISPVVMNADPAGDSRAVREMATSSDFIALIGPLFSNHALMYAPIADAGHIPMISPTATANGIAEKSKYVFQANADARARGRAMARYAVNDLGLRTIAVLASTDQQSKALANEFVQEAKQLGATIAVSETYDKDSTDLREQFMKMREAGATGEPSISFTQKFKRVQLQSMIRAGADRDALSEARKKREIIPVTKLFGPRGKQIADSLHLPLIISLGETYNIEVPVTGIQALFAVIAESDDISVVASQMSYFNIRAQLLGSGEWYDRAQLEANRRYVDGAIFVADSYFDDGDSLDAAFEQSYLRTMKKKPTRNTLFGYDTMSLLLTQVEHGVRTREQLQQALERVEGYRGIHATITLSHGRVNSHVHILKYQNNEIIKITEINVN